MFMRLTKQQIALAMELHTTKLAWRKIAALFDLNEAQLFREVKKAKELGFAAWDK